MRLGLLILLAYYASAFAADAQIDALRASLLEMRKEPAKSSGPRGATPQLTIAKHQLRDWVESRLPALTERGDAGELERKLNSELRDAKLFCSEVQAPECPDETFSGFLGELTLKRQSGFLIVETALGIECGFDESAYIYSWSSEGWRRVWQTEQNAYTKKEYRPQSLNAVLISPYSKGNDYLVLTLGSESWCSSTWHDVYYRVYRMGPDLEARPLLEGSEWAWLGKHDPPIQGSVSTGDVLVEFTVRSIDAGVHNREVVRHYRIDRDKVERVAPLALSPRDFVDEWVTTDWKETGHWSEPENRRATRDWHTKLHKDFVAGEFIYPTMHCTSTPDLWQVGVAFSDPPTPIGVNPQGVYFLVRWRPPYEFTMVQISDRPSPACTEQDRKADEEPRTLFPVQEWR